MQATHVESLERTIQKTNEWLKAIQDEMGAEDREHAYLALRATLHALRDRLTPDEALHLGAQLPALIRGVYFGGWTLADKPAKVRSKNEFLGVVAVEAGEARLDYERAAQAVFAVLSEKVSRGEIRDVLAELPAPIRELWPD